MAALPTNNRYVARIGKKEFTGSGARFENGDTLFARITPCLENGKGAFVSGLAEGFGGFGSTEFIVLRAKEKSDANFVYYLTRYPEFRKYAEGRMSGSSGRQRVSWDALAEYELHDLGKGKRQAIGDLLAALDDKIELNRQMNDSLEAMARAIFKSWFVDFDPVRAKMEGRDTGLVADISALFPDFMNDEIDAPKGWRYVPLSELTSELRRGIAPKYIEHGGVRVINQRCIRDRKVSFDASRRHDTEQRAIDGREIEVGDILVNSTGVGTLGRVGQVWTLTETTVADSHVTVVRAKDEISSIYLGRYLLFREVEIESLGEGSTGQTELSRTRLGDLPILVPSSPVLDAFDKFADPILKRISASDEECRTLASLRDLLLPRLISGEVHIGDAERLVGELGA